MVRREPGSESSAVFHHDLLVALLPSASSDAGAWDPVSSVLRARGWDVAVPSLPADTFDPEEVSAAFLAGLPKNRSLVLVPHGDAGLQVPLLCAERDVASIVFVDARLPAPGGWDRVPCSYLAFGDTYAAETRRAGTAGWPIEVMWGEHLQMLIDPAAVASAILSLSGP